MATPIDCCVATPTRELYFGKVYYVDVPSVDGSYGVLPGHEMAVTLNKDGGICTLHLDEAGTQKEQFILLEGATQVYKDRVTVLGRFGKNVKDIDVDAIEEKARVMREHIEQLEAESDTQDRAEARVAKKRLKWYETQIEYAKRAKN